MVLVDTSVWIDHLRQGNKKLTTLLEEGRVLTHPWVIGELACGNLPRRGEILGLLDALPKATTASDEEVMAFIEKAELAGKGMGWVDVHLLAAARLSDAPLFTLDQSLVKVARKLNVAD